MIQKILILLLLTTGLAWAGDNASAAAVQMIGKLQLLFDISSFALLVLSVAALAQMKTDRTEKK